MANIDEGIRDLRQAMDRRVAAESRASGLWRDVVYRRLQDRMLTPLQVEDLALLRTLTDADAEISRLLREL
ncbi:hypothetical protein [Frondihabitans australicus]|uniref:Uncharacterized protein n=1 Tax=Frondihabitans australicus TaxID=386892 RepID=A0A495IMD5_9MICO|nr:hypothetical protein [Frondihabitans australicus]RKR76285.1 hypothetical protein C8E83_3452 [Frondihabitans australicus]